MLRIAIFIGMFCIVSSATAAQIFGFQKEQMSLIIFGNLSERDSENLQNKLLFSGWIPDANLEYNNKMKSRYFCTLDVRTIPWLAKSQCYFSKGLKRKEISNTLANPRGNDANHDFYIANLPGLLDETVSIVEYLFIKEIQK